ncbi:unnamed protein product, partial [Adineta ricciae]
MKNNTRSFSYDLRPRLQRSLRIQHTDRNFDVDGSSTSARGVLNSHHNVSSTSPHNQPSGTTNTTSKTATGTTNSTGMHRRESFLYKCDSDNDLSPKCISRNPSIGSE